MLFTAKYCSPTCSRWAWVGAEVGNPEGLAMAGREEGAMVNVDQERDYERIQQVGERSAAPSCYCNLLLLLLPPPATGTSCYYSLLLLLSTVNLLLLLPTRWRIANDTRCCCAAAAAAAALLRLNHREQLNSNTAHV